MARVSSRWQAGCPIEETELRAITVPQLKDVRTHIERRCEPEGWLNGFDQSKLTSKTVNLYVTRHLSSLASQRAARRVAHVYCFSRPLLTALERRI